MMFAKNVLLGSLSFATVWMVGDWSGAIAQVPYSSRYLSNQEINSLEPEFERATKFMNAFSGEALRTYSTQINRIVNAWQKVDPSMPNFAPFLGTWTYMDDVSLHIYPSQRKGRVCVVEAVLGYPPAYNFGTVQGGRLVSDGELGKVVITRKKSNRTKNSQEGVFLAKYSFSNGKRSVLPLHFPRHLGLNDFRGIGKLDKGRFTQMGCTTSLSP